MRVINIPAKVTIDGNDYEISFQAFQDDVISALVGRTWNISFEGRTDTTLAEAVRVIKSKLVTINPFVVSNNQYYIGDTSISGYMEDIFNAFNIKPICLAASGTQPTGYTLNNGSSFTWSDSRDDQYIRGTEFELGYWADLNRASGYVNTLPTQYWQLNLSYLFFPSSAITGSSMSKTDKDFINLGISIYGRINASFYPEVLNITMSVTSEEPSIAESATIYGDLIDIPYEDINAEATGFSGDDPYVIDPSSIGGGYGTGSITPSDFIDDPTAPNIDAVSTGLITIFKPSLSQVQQLGDYLWSSAFDVDTLKKLFGDPMEAIIGLSIVPVNPPGGGTKNVKIGDIDTGITMPYLNRQFVEKSLGSITIAPYVGSFLDYSPYTKIQIYLPYIGFRDLAPEDVMGCTLSIKYIIDVVSGGCNAIINVSGKGAIYQFNGSAIANIPLSAINYSGAIQNAVSAIGSGVTTAVGIATGQAPIAALGMAGMATNAANAAVNSKPTIQHSGTMGGAAGLCSVQYPYCIIERPRLAAPARYNYFIGNTLNVTMTLGSCKGLTMVDSIHLDNITCTDNERDELMRLLKEGVIL